MELNKLKYLLGNYYHQDVWVDHSQGQHKEVWKTFLKQESQENVNQLCNDINQLLKCSSEEILSFLNKENSGGLLIKSPDEAKKWLENLKTFLCDSDVQQSKN